MWRKEERQREDISVAIKRITETERLYCFLYKTIKMEWILQVGDSNTVSINALK